MVVRGWLYKQVSLKVKKKRAHLWCIWEHMWNSHARVQTSLGSHIKFTVLAESEMVHLSGVEQALDKHLHHCCEQLMVQWGSLLPRIWSLSFLFFVTISFCEEHCVLWTLTFTKRVVTLPLLNQFNLDLSVSWELIILKSTRQKVTDQTQSLRTTKLS